MIQRGCVLIIVLLFFAKVAWSAPESSQSLYLSFEQRLAATYALAAQGETPDKKKEIAHRALRYFYTVSQKPVETVVVRNFAEFLKHFQGDWPNTHSVAYDLEVIEQRAPVQLKIFKSQSRRVQHRIDQYILWQKLQLLEKAQSMDTLNFSVPFLLLAGLQNKALENPAIFQNLESVALSLSDQVVEKQIKEFDQIGKKIADASFDHQKDPMARIFLQTILGEYFSRLKLSSKKLIFSAFLGENLYLSDMDKFKIMVQNSGPILQKFLQVAAREAGLEGEALEIFRSLEDSVKQVPWHQVQQILEAEKGTYDFTYFERKPLGVGSMAQVHRSKIQVNGNRKDVVARFIKPGIKERIDEDHKILMEVAKILDNNLEFRKTGAPLLTPIVQDISATVYAELDQGQTIRWQKIATERYSKTVDFVTPGYKNVLQFNVPQLYPGQGPSQLMVQEMVIGRKLDKEVDFYKENIPGMKKAIVESMATLWADELVFGSGFFHSDLHQGNFLINVMDSKIVVNILDYGMGGMLSPELQTQLLVLGAGLELKRPEMIAKAFWKISEKGKNILSEEEFLLKVKERVKQINEGQERKVSLEHWTAWAMDSGLRLPYEFVSLNRGIVIVNKLLEDSKVPMSVVGLIKKQALRHPEKVYDMLVRKEKFAHEDLLKVGWLLLRKVMKPISGDGNASVKEMLRCEAVL